MDNRAIFGMVSTISALLPIIVGSFAFRKHRFAGWFLLFLVYGFITDVVNALSDKSTGVIEETTLALFIQNVYSLVDATFIFWFLGRMINSPRAARYTNALALSMLPIWFVCSFILKDTLIRGNSLSALFETGYGIIIVIVSAFVLLKMTEIGQRNPSQSLIWLVIGLFFYNFCHFFLSCFVSSEIADKIWFMSNLINVITMFMYSYAFFKQCQWKDQ